MASREIDDFFAGMEKKKNEEMLQAERMAAGKINEPEPTQEKKEEIKEEKKPEREETPKAPRQKTKAPERKERSGKSDSMQQTIRLSPEARRGIKLMAIDENRTISDIVEEWYWEHARKAARKAGAETPEA